MKQIPNWIESFMETEVELDRNKYDIVSLHDWHPEDSDWKMSVEEYLRSRINAWLDIIAISDHNTLSTNKKAIKYTEFDKKSEFYGKLKIIPSIELSLWWQFPWHLIFVDFDLKEFQKVFYEEYLFEYLSKFFENNKKISNKLMWRIMNGGIDDFQPSQLELNTDTALIFEAIIAMKRDPAYKYIIFPWDTPKEVFDKLLFHFERWNITKFPIIQIPHPTLWREMTLLKPIWHTLGRHIDSLKKLWLTTYWWLVQSEDSKDYLLKELEHLQMYLLSKWQNLNILFEIHNDKDITDWGSSMNSFDAFRALGAIPCIWFDWHEEKTPSFWLLLPKWIDLRSYIESEEFKNYLWGRLKITRLKEWLWVKKMSQKIKELVSDLIFMQRWNIDPICNEFVNLDPENPDLLAVYHTVNSLDDEMTENEVLSKTVSRGDIKKYKKTQKRWKSAKTLQNIFVRSKDMKNWDSD